MFNPFERFDRLLSGWQTKEIIFEQDNDGNPTGEVVVRYTRTRSIEDIRTELKTPQEFEKVFADNCEDILA